MNPMAFFIFEPTSGPMKKNIILFFTIVFSLFGSASAQNVEYAQRLIDTLAGPSFDGRGYVNSGDVRASKFIAQEFEAMGAMPLKSDSYFHHFSLNVNTFPGKVEVELLKNNDQDWMLQTGVDFIVDPACPSIHVNGLELVWITEAMLLDNKQFKKLLKKKTKGNVMVVDTVSTANKLANERRREFIHNGRSICIIDIQRKLTWSVSRTQSVKVVLQMLPGVIKDAQQISIHVEAKFVQDYKARNVIALIPGTEQPDSFIVFTAHYDHLGRMGSEVYIPGANDNASGTAMMLDMASYFAKHPPKYSVVFIAFAAEEAGLVGSFFFVQEMEAWLEKDKIRFLLNMDLMGSGELGIMAVNGKIFTKEYELLKKINDEGNYLSEVKSRGKAANSDHYFFSEAGVPCFFVYLMGSFNYYHEVEDSPENLRLQKEYYDKTYSLLFHFLTELM
jgi:aminopeptidase YwaD